MFVGLQSAYPKENGKLTIISTHLSVRRLPCIYEEEDVYAVPVTTWRSVQVQSAQPSPAPIIPGDGWWRWRHLTTLLPTPPTPPGNT